MTTPAQPNPPLEDFAKRVENSPLKAIRSPDVRGDLARLARMHYVADAADADTLSYAAEMIIRSVAGFVNNFKLAAAVVPLQASAVELVKRRSEAGAERHR